jgi:hypothetical protein
MIISLPYFRGPLWLLATILIGLGFPLQVLSMTPAIAITPYILITAVLILDFVSRSRNRCWTSTPFNTIDFYVALYASLVLLNTGAQFALGLISADETISAVVIFIFPITFYIAFRAPRSDLELKSVYLGIAIPAVIGAVYFAYDSYSKLALGHVNSYAAAAFEYSLSRANQIAAEANQARISTGSRSFGLLESHAVSGTWVIMGTIASLALNWQARSITRKAIIFVFGSLLFLGLNFTTIAAFSVVTLYSEITYAPRTKRFNETLKICAGLMAIILLLISSLWFFADNLADTILKIGDYQARLLIGGNDDGVSAVGLLEYNLLLYLDHAANQPFLMITGDGFSSYGMPKGGDIGMIETISRLGLPFYSLSIALLLTVFIRAFQRITENNDFSLEKRDLIFATSLAVVIFLTEIHYSVWASKSILPLIFFALGVCRQRFRSWKNPHLHQQIAI